jgi:hypothetical protein
LSVVGRSCWQSTPETPPPHHRRCASWASCLGRAASSRPPRAGRRTGGALDRRAPSDRDRELASALQRGSPTRLSELATTCARSVRTGACHALGCAILAGSVDRAPASAAINPELTFKADHPVGANQWEIGHG